MTLRYAHVTDPEVGAAAERIGKMIESTMKTGLTVDGYRSGGSPAYDRFSTFRLRGSTMSPTRVYDPRWRVEPRSHTALAVFIVSRAGSPSPARAPSVRSVRQNVLRPNAVTGSPFQS